MSNIFSEKIKETLSIQSPSKFYTPAKHINKKELEAFLHKELIASFVIETEDEVKKTIEATIKKAYEAEGGNSEELGKLHTISKIHLPEVNETRFIFGIELVHILVHVSDEVFVFISVF